MSQKSENSLVSLVTSQAIAIITKSTPFGNIPIINSAMNSIVSGTINIVLNKTILSGYIKSIEEDILKQSAEVMEARSKLENPNISPEERIENEKKLKEGLRNLFDFRS